jgi:putative transposase
MNSRRSQTLRLARQYSAAVPSGLKRYQQARCLHFLTFSCYQRRPLLSSPTARDAFEVELERARKWYGFFVSGYVVMPEHVHLLISEPERKSLSVALQMLKQNVSRKLRRNDVPNFWLRRSYDFLVWTNDKRLEKLTYMHFNPVKRRLVERPEDWKWSSFLHIATGEEGTVEVESEWTGRKRERSG